MILYYNTYSIVYYTYILYIYNLVRIQGKDRILTL